MANVSIQGYDASNNQKVVQIDEAGASSTGYKWLANADLSGGAAVSINSGVFTAKRNLRIYFYTSGLSGSDQLMLRFNADSTSGHYSYARSTDWVLATAVSNTTEMRLDAGGFSGGRWFVIDISNADGGGNLPVGVSWNGATAVAVTSTYNAYQGCGGYDNNVAITSVQVLTVGGSATLSATNTTIAVFGTNDDGT